MAPYRGTEQNDQATGLVPMCCDTKLPHYYWLYSPCFIFHPLTHSFGNWKSATLNLLQQFLYHSIPLPPDNQLFVLCIYESVVFLHLFCFFRFPHISHIICYSSVSVISLCIVLSSFIHVVANGKISFSFMAEYHSIPWVTTSSLSIHLSMDTGCFLILASKMMLQWTQS